MDNSRIINNLDPIISTKDLLVQDLVKCELLEAIMDIEALCDPQSISDYDALNQVLAMYCSKDELTELELRDINPVWVEIMVGARQ